MSAFRWQKQHIYYPRIVWGVSAVISFLLILIMLVFGFSIEVAGVFFLLTFAALRLLLAYLFKNRYANSMVRLLKSDYEALERDFRMVFKNNQIRFTRQTDAEAYSYDFPGHSLSMTVQPHWAQIESPARPFTKVTLHELTAKNEAFAQTLAESIDEMIEQRPDQKTQ